MSLNSNYKVAFVEGNPKRWVGKLLCKLNSEDKVTKSVDDYMTLNDETLKHQRANPWNHYRDKIKIKRKGDEGITGFVTIQWLSAYVEGKAQKYSRIGSLESVQLTNSAALTLEALKKACCKHFRVSQECDIVLSQHGPSVTDTSQVNLKNEIHIRFLESSRSPGISLHRSRLQLPSSLQGIPDSRHLYTPHRPHPANHVEVAKQRNTSKHFKNTNYTCLVSVKVSKVDNEYRCEVVIEWEHNHSTKSLEALSFKNICKDVREKVKCFFLQPFLQRLPNMNL